MNIFVRNYSDYSLEAQLFPWMDSGPEDNVAEYYQQQVEMLEGFNEMDALAERGFVPGMSRVCINDLYFLICIYVLMHCRFLEAKIPCFTCRKRGKIWPKVRHLLLEYQILLTWFFLLLKFLPR